MAAKVAKKCSIARPLFIICPLDSYAYQFT
jgi:hypothetical protein